jgi:hypothetical protein
MKPLIHRSTAAVTTLLFAASLITAAATPSFAARPASGIPFNYDITATTTLKKLNQTVTIKHGSFTGSINLSTLKLTGAITLPEATAPISIAGLPALATATFKISEVGPVTGKVDFAKATATATSVFNIQIVSITPAGLPINLVGDNCTTSKPVKVTISGSLKAPITFSGTYTIPPLQNCGALTPALNQVVPGPGNNFTAVARPKKG